jgi:two-component system phosphate regulon response regulator PhoB
VPDGNTASDAPLALLIDDLEEIRKVVRERLLANGINVIEATSGEAGLDALATHPIDVVVLDVGLPGIDGFAVLRSIRQTSQVPIVMLTGADHEADRVLGLEMGADDYVVKPFSARELVARVRAVLRRTQAQVPTNAPSMTFRRLTVDTSGRVASVDGAPLPLTPREFDLLVHLCSSPGKSFSREELLREVWQSAPEWQNVATVTEHIHRLRRHIETDAANPTHLITVRGSGYRFDP